MRLEYGSSIAGQQGRPGPVLPVADRHSARRADPHRLFNWAYARHAGGTFVFRIEDTDAARDTEESYRHLLDALRWLGLDWDEGPEVGGPHGPYRQSERHDIYADVAARLVRRRPRCTSRSRRRGGRGAGTSRPAGTPSSATTTPTAT